MKRHAKVSITLFLIAILVMICATPVCATWYYPDGASVYENIEETDDYNRTIYVYHKDTAGNLLKYCEYYTGTVGEYDVFGDSIYGYDIIEYSSNQGIGEKCILTWASGNNSTAAYGQIGYEFYKLISKKSMTLNFTYRKQESTTFNIKHYLVDQNGNQSLYNTSTSVYAYGDSMSIYRKYPTGYSLRNGYVSSITGPFTYDVLDIEKNVEDRIYYNRTPDAHSGEKHDRKSFTWDDEDWLDYCTNREINVTFFYDLNQYTITFDANGGSGAPNPVTKYYGETLILPVAVPTKSGYTFKGWGISSSSSTPSYQSGGNYTSNSSRTLYAIWESTVPTTYTVSYNANGGSGAPASQTKTHGVALTLSSSCPTRMGYNFLGWSTSSTATSAMYNPGDSYSANAPSILYAVWEKANYEFSISNLTVSDSEPYRCEEITVKVRTDSWDKVNPYSNIPVQLYYDGQLISTQYANFAAYGIANLTFTLDVGNTSGSHSIEVRINWSDRSNESNSGNNQISTSLNVQDFDYELSIDAIHLSENYCAGETVISSFTVKNDGMYDITPTQNNSAQFTAYYYNSSQKVVINSDIWENVVVPGEKSNLVFFKWTIPSDLAGKTVYCECTINYDGSISERNRDNNTATFSTTIVSFPNSQTPNTRYESTTPSLYKGNSAPVSSTETAIWTMWVYENNQFVLKTYGIQISTTSPVITPSDDCKSAVYANGKWTIRSGYGFTMSYTPTIATVSGYNNPASSAYTSVQSVYATFPEFNYATTSGNFRTLRYVNGTWQFVQNSNAANSNRIHFIPVWFADGNYTVSVTATRVWTPVGVISATRTANTFNIDGSIYDDYFVGN